ncbi:MAG: RHS repeat protein, partial [Chlamydiia bacterium]|nr:RHS repeat protein [Chlamydiia bacterium]
MKRILFAMAIAFSLNANEQTQTLALTHGEPSSMVEGCVSAITGGLYLNQADIVVKGAEPITFTRQYVSDHYLSTYRGWQFCGISSASHIKIGINFLINDGRGIYLDFYINDLNKAEKLRKKKQAIPLVLDPGWLNAAISNSANHEISARTNLYNMRAQVSHDYNWLRVYLPDGGERHYEVVKNTKKDECPTLSYMLTKEIKPSRNIIHYEYTKDGNLLKISSHSPDEKTTYAWIKLSYHGDVKKLKDFTVTTSDGQEREYCFDTVEYQEPNPCIHRKYWKKQCFYLSTYRSNTTPNEAIEYRSLISEIKLPDGRYRSFEYDDKNRVKCIYGPVGPNGKKQALYTFKYADKKTNVFDALGNRVQYTYNDKYRLTHIHRYQGRDQLLNIEQFTWGKNNGLDATLLKARTLFDPEKQPIHSRQFIYDCKGNPIEERYFGTITGTCEKLKINAGLPVAGSGDCAITMREYSSDKHNLLIQETHPNGLVMEVSHYPGTDLVKSRIHKQGNQILKREFFFYDASYRLIEEVVDDGNVLEYQQHAIGSYRVHTRYDLLKSGPFIGMPKTITKTYLSQKSPHLQLINMEELDYDKFGNVTKRHIYDSNRIKQFTLQQIYDGRNRLQKIVNAIGEEETFTYDANNNLIKHLLTDGSTKTYKYDKANRLVAAAHEAHKDTYAYNAKSEQISQTNYLDNTTTFKYDALGNCIQKTGPPAPTPPITTTSYTPDGYPQIITDPNGNKTITAYNIYGKPLTIQHPDAATESFTYDINGNLITHTNQAGTTTKYTYDIFDRVLTKATEDHVKSYTYDAFKLLKKIDPEGNLTHCQYDPAGRKVTQIQNQETATYEYDALGRLHKTIHHADDNTLIEINKYDNLDRVITTKSEDLDGKIYSKTCYSYDSNGNKTTIHSFIGAKNIKAIEQTIYDAFNRQISQTDALEYTTTTHYLEQDHHLIKITTNPKGLRTIEIFDPLDHLIESRLEDPSGQELNKETFLYDLNGNKLSQTSTIYSPTETRSSTTQWKYDPKNRPIQITEAANTSCEKTTYIAYTPTGKKATITKPDGITLTHQYDSHDRLKHLTSS